jgi:hypothetical protein
METCCDLSSNEELCNFVFKESDQVKEEEMDRPCNMSGGGGIYRVLTEIVSKEWVSV